MLRKKMLTWLFLAVFFASLGLFFFRKASHTHQHNDGSQKSAQIVLEDFKLSRYQGTKVQSGASGKLAYFYDPNLVEVLASFDVFRLSKDGRPERLKAEMAKAYLKADSISELMEAKNLLISQGLVEDHVVIQSNDHELESDQVWYQGTGNILHSEKKVFAKGPKRNFCWRLRI